MIYNLSNWAKNIVIVTLIGTIIEMILPDTKNKKYIKVVIGIYILFNIISPFIGKSIDLNEYNIEKYISTKEEKNTENKEQNTEKVFKQKVIENIRNKLRLVGYDSDNIEVQINANYTINSIKIAEVNEYKSTDSDEVKKIVIGEKNGNKAKINNGEKNKIIQDLAEAYQIEKNNIDIE